MTTTPEALASGIAQLASFPDLAFRIDETLSDENKGAADIGSLIQLDPALSAALLKIANSAIYNVGGQVDSIEQAVTVVGLREVRDLTFGICANKTFRGIPNELITVEDFWKHSLYCAAAAQAVARRTKICRGESLFSAGLLHDIGHLVMFRQSPVLSKEALLLSLEENDGLSPYLSERKVFGFDHMSVGAELARQWQLPGVVTECIEFHHDPFASDEATGAALIVHIANCIAVLAELDSQDLGDAPPLDERTFTELGLSEECIPELLEQTQETVAELLRIFIN